MSHLGLVIADEYVAYAIAKGTDAKKFSAMPSTGGFTQRLKAVLDEASAEIRKAGKKLTSVHIVTDEVRHSLEEGRNLDRVALFRLSAPEGRNSPPLLDRGLAKHVLSDFFVLSGGHGFDGRIIARPSESEIEAAYSKSHAESFVVSSSFSILFPDHEDQAAMTLHKSGAKRIWRSKDISAIPSTLDRESTAIFSASTSSQVGKIAEEVKSGLAEYGAHPQIYFGRNDGGVIGSALAERYPLETAWAVEAHAAAGVSRLSRNAHRIVASQSREHTWLAGAAGSRPITRKIVYLRDTLLHVTVPVLAEFPAKVSKDAAKVNFGLMADLVGSRKIVSTGPQKALVLPFAVESSPRFSAAAAVNAALAEVRWERGSCVARGSDVKEAERRLRTRLSQQMKQAAARNVKFGRLNQRPGFNLPEGALTLSLQATGLPA